MGLLRHSAQLLHRTVASSADALSDVVLVRPVEGDVTTDHDQTFGMLIYFDQHGAGSVTAAIYTSFGDGLWVRLKDHTLTTDGADFLAVGDLEGFAPYLQVRVRATAPGESTPKPTFRVIARLASDGPFKATPANPPNLIEAVATEKAS